MDDDARHMTEESDGIPTVLSGAAHQGAPDATEEANGHVPVAECAERTPPPLQIAFSVYTAANGYDWSNIPDGCDHEGLDFYYQKAVERKPDFMAPGDVVKGVFARDGNIAAFRIQVVKHWDSFGRNADYGAFAFLTYEEARRVDFESLLDLPDFTDPRHDPPTSISYAGEASKDINSEESVAAIQKLYNQELLQSFDFSKIGALLSAHGNKSASWLFCKVECAIENSTTVSTGDWTENPYPLPPPPPAQSPEPVEEPPHESFTTAQRIEPIEVPVPTRVPMPGPQMANAPRQAVPCTVVVGARLRTQVPATALQETFRQPVTGRNHVVHDNSCVMKPVSTEEMMRISEGTKHKSSGWFGFDTLTIVLAGVCAILVAVLLLLVFYLFFQKGSVNIGISLGKEQPVLKTDESGFRGIMPLEDDKADLRRRHKKGGK